MVEFGQQPCIVGKETGIPIERIKLLRSDTPNAQNAICEPASTSSSERTSGKSICCSGRCDGSKQKGAENRVLAPRTVKSANVKLRFEHSRHRP